MAWIQPKTDWVSADYFNPEDYNRIVGNLYFLKEMGEKLFGTISLIPMSSEKTFTSMIYASEINNIEKNLVRLNTYTYGFDDLNKFVRYKDNGSTPLYSEFNRLESGILKLYNTMITHKENISRLSFTLGNQKGIRV